MKRSILRARRTDRSGLTFAEVAISTLLVGLLLLAAVKSSTGVLQNWSAVSDRYRMAHLADQLLSEAVQNSYAEPGDTPVFGRESGESASVRAAWDDTDDFDGWRSSPPQERDGTEMLEFTGWTRAIAVRLAEVDDPTATPLSDEGLKMIEVTVTSPNGDTLVRSALRSRWGQVDQPPLVDTDWTASVTTTLTLADGTTSTTSSNLPNSVEDTP